MKKLITILIVVSLFYIPAHTSDKKSKTTTANNAVISIDLPSIPIHNNYTKKVHVTGITILYKLTGESTQKSITTATKTVIPPKRGKTFSLKLALPTTSDSAQTAEYLGVSEIKVDTDTIKFDKPWTGLTGSKAIIIKNISNSWKLDHDAMKKSAEDKKEKSKTTKDATTQTKTSSQKNKNKTKPTTHYDKKKIKKTPQKTSKEKLITKKAIPTKPISTKQKTTPVEKHPMRETVKKTTNPREEAMKEAMKETMIHAPIPASPKKTENTK